MGAVSSIVDAIPALPDKEELSKTEIDSEESSAYTNPSDESFEYSDSDSDDDYPEVKVKVKVKTKVDNSWMVKELKDLGIKLNFSNKIDATAMSEFQSQIEKMSIDGRNDQMEEILSGENEFIASNIYTITVSEFTLSEDVTVTVKLARYISKRHKVMVKMKTDGKWIKMDATFKSGSAEFKTKKFGHFAIVGELVKKKVKISSEGAKVKVDETSKIEVDIPAGAFEADQDVNFKIIPPDSTAMKRYMSGEKPLCRSIIGVTECLYGDSQSVALRKPFSVTLPFEDRQDQEENTTVVPFKMKGREIEMLDAQADIGVNEDGVCKIQMSEFCGVFAGVVRNDCLSNIKFLERDAGLIFGTKYVATILMFREREKMSTGFPRIWIEIVDKMNVAEVVQERLQENLVELPNSRSPDVSIFDGFRLRIDVGGNLQGLRDIPRNYYLITYLDVAKDNHKMFTLEKAGSLNTNFGRISFSSDKGAKRCVHEIEVDTVIGFSKVFRSDGHSDKRPVMFGPGIDAVPEEDHGSSGNPDQQTASESEPSAFCPALNDSSLSKMADMMQEADDGLKFSVHLQMSDDFENINQNCQTSRDAVYNLLKEWLKKQSTLEEAVERLNKALNAAHFTKMTDGFMNAVKKDQEF